MAQKMLKLGDNTELEETDDGEPILRHKPSGAEFKYDSAAGAWKPTADIDMGSKAIKNAGSVGSDSASITNDVSAGSIDTEEVTINDFAAVFGKTSDQSISANTSTTVDWDNQDVDTDLYTYDSSTDTIDVLAAGDYGIDFGAVVTGMTDQNFARFQVFVNGSQERNIPAVASGTAARWSGGILLKDLSANDTIRIDMRTEDAATIFGSVRDTYAMISKEA